MVTGGILIAAAAWYFTFAIEWGNFWLKIGGSVVLICLYSLAFQRPHPIFTRRSVLTGSVSAAVLYLIFFIGNSLSPFFVEGAGAQVQGIYSLGAGSNKILVFLLLLLVTGPGEEIFWRGFLQENLMKRCGPRRGFALATAIYTGVHVFSMNFILVMAALVAGAFWGGLYLWKRDLAAVMVSHSLWSSFIFAVFPMT